MSTFRERPQDICRPTKAQCAKGGKRGGVASGETRRFAAIQRVRREAIEALPTAVAQASVRQQLEAWAAWGWLDDWLRDVYLRGRRTGYQMVYLQRRKAKEPAA